MRKIRKKREKREQVFAEQGAICRFCGATENLTIDHILAQALGGTNAKENLQVLCESCNNRKSVEEGNRAVEREVIKPFLSQCAMKMVFATCDDALLMVGMLTDPEKYQRKISQCDFCQHYHIYKDKTEWTSPIS
jgi:hypothetical protein